jgi:catechol 2,3-dioxygenase
MQPVMHEPLHSPNEPATSTTPSSRVPSPAFRLPDATRIGGVHLQVSDLRTSVAYYEDVIGLRILDQSRDATALAVRGDDRAMVTLHSTEGVTSVRRGAYGLYHFAILLPDRAALGRFATHLGSQHVRVGMADHLVSEALYLWDPDGLGIEVYADRPRETWRHLDGELVMTTDPLDIESVIAAGGGVRWDGLPPGTTMGHVHLHVGNLEEAERFYSSGLGFEPTVWSYPGALFLAAGGYHHHLGTNTWAPGPAPEAHHARLLEWELVVPEAEDVNGARRSLESAGYAPEYAAESLLLADPWGTRLRVLAAVRPRARTASSSARA